MSTVIMSDQVQHILTHAWTGVADNSASIEMLDGVEVRRNLSFNPSFTSGTNNTGYTSGLSLTRDTTTYHSGPGSAKATMTAAGSQFLVLTIPSAEAATYNASFWYMLPNDVATPYTISASSFDSSGAFLGVQTFAPFTMQSATDWTQVSWSFDAPDGTAQVRFYITAPAAVVGEVFYIDDVLLETGSVGQPYFDGSTPAQYIYGQVNPLLVDGWAESSNSRNIVNPIVGGGVDYVLYPSDLRAGTFTMLFDDEQAAVDAFNMHRQPATFTLTDTDRPSLGMSYISNGTTQRVLDDQSRKYWTVSVTYQEVDD